MKKYIAPVLAFCTVCALSALLAWLCGFNFDRRSVDVGFWAFTTLFLAVAAYSDVRKE